jgi:hypothetical protein
LVAPTPADGKLKTKRAAVKGLAMFMINERPALDTFSRVRELRPQASQTLAKVGRSECLP